MIQRLFFDGINLQGGRRAVSEAIEFSALIDADEAESRLTGPDVAMPRTEVAVDFPRRFQVPPAGFMQPFCLLEDLQLFHRSSSQALLYLWTEETVRVIHVCWGGGRDSGVAPAVEALSFRCPIHKPFHVVAVLPGKMKELAGRQIGGLLPKECLKAPTDVGTFPRIESIASSRIPVILQCLNISCAMGESPSPLRQDPSFRPPELKDAHARAPNSPRASAKYRCTGDPSQSSYRLSIFPSNALAPSSTRSSRGGSLSDPCPQSV